MDIKEIGLRIKTTRKIQNLTQEKLSEMIDVSPHYIYEIEKGLKTMSITVLYALSVSLKVSSDYLLFGRAYNCQDMIESPVDRLTLLTRNLPSEKKECLADIISVTIPYLK